jgi:hypothetical protein
VLDRVIPHALATVTATEALSWFAHCGYALQELENRYRGPAKCGKFRYAIRGGRAEGQRQILERVVR